MAASSDKVIIEVGLNENQDRQANRHLPYSPAEIASAAQSCYDAGASIVHYHGRRGKAGEPALSDPELNAEIQRRISESTPLIAYPSYGSQVRVLDYYDIGTPAPQRYAHIVAAVEAGVRFEVIPVDLGVLDINAGWDAEKQQLIPSTGLLMNTGRDHEWILDFCRRHTIKPHFTVFDTANVQNLANIVHWKWVDDEALVVKLFLIGANATPKMVLFYQERLRDVLPGLDLIWMPLVYATNQLPICAVSISLGGHARVGIGDHAYRERGEPTNAELVEQIVTIARALGRDPASPDEARRQMGIAERDHGRREEDELADG